MRLVFGERDLLPKPQGLLYMKPDLCLFHESDSMTEPRDLPETVTVADAPQGNWVDRFAPLASRPYLRLSRADRPIGTWLLLLPCWWGLLLAASVDGLRLGDLWIAVACAIGSVLMRGAGCTWNDFTDREFDAQVARTRSRPLPSGQVSPKAALIWAGAQVAISAMLLLTLPLAATALALAALVPVVIYPFAKRFTWWPQAFLGIAFNWGALMGWAAHSGALSAAPALLYASGIAWTLFYDTIYAHQDKDDDALIGVKSTARLFGQNTARWLSLFLVLTVLLMAAAVLVALLPSGRPLALGLGLCAPWVMGWHLWGQLRALDTENPEICLRIFRSNRDAGLLAGLFLAGAALV